MESKEAENHIGTPDLDQIIQKMDDQLESFARDNDRRERFLLMYRTFKNELRKNLQQGRFLDSEWSEAICCRMGSMYFEAKKAYQHNVKACPESWSICFDASATRETNLLQDALMGMNAHINYDLTICVYDVMHQSGDFTTLREEANAPRVVDRKLNSLLKKRYFDYLLINQIAWESIPLIQDVLTNRFSKVLDLLNRLSFRFSRSLVEQLILNYRDRAWTHALLLLSTSDQQERHSIRAFIDDLAISNARLIKKFVTFNPVNIIRSALKPETLEKESEKEMNPVTADLLKEKLDQRETSEYASRTFVEYGNAAVPYLGQMLDKEPQDRDTNKQVYRILGKIGTGESARLLASCAQAGMRPHRALFKAILQHDKDQIQTHFNTDVFNRFLVDLLYNYSLTARIAEDLEQFSDSSLMQQTLGDRNNELVQHIKLVIEIVLLIRGVPRRIADISDYTYGFRIITEEVGKELASLAKSAIRSTVENVLVLASKHFQLEPMSARDRITDILKGNDEWLKLCTYLYINSDETQIDIQISKHTIEDTSMITIVKKVLYLKKVELFNEIPAEELTSIAKIAREHKFSKNEYLIRRGEPGKNLYVITNGRVKVQKNGSLITTLGEGDVLGEIALLTDSTTSADCVAAIDTKTLQLNQRDFLDFLYEGYPEIALGLIKILIKRLEKTTAQLGSSPT